MFRNAFERRIETEFNAFGHRNLEQAVADLLVITAQYLVTAIDDGDMRSKAVKHPGKFVRNIYFLTGLTGR